MSQVPDTDASETIEQSQETLEPPVQYAQGQLDAVHALAERLIGELDRLPNGDLVGQIVANALKLLRDQISRGDVKLINKSFAELRYALKVFAPYHEVRKVSIFGSARTPEDHPDYLAAAEFARKMVAEGWMVTTGAGGGIMAAGHGGAGADPSFGLSIRLPFEQRTNVHIARDPKLINFKYFFTRKLMFVRTSHAIAAFPGGFGTLDEAFEVLTLIQTGKSVPAPVVFIDHKGGDFWRHWEQYVVSQLMQRRLIGEHDRYLYKITDDIDQAVHEVRKFYRNYHSVRYYRDDLIIRLQRAPSDEQLEQIRRDFADICAKGDFKVTTALPVEQDEPSLATYPRLVFSFNRKDHGRLRRLIDRLNEF